MNISQANAHIIYDKNPEVICREILDEIILVPISGNLANMQNIFSLDAVGAFIWDNLDGQITLGDIHQKILKEFDVESDQALTDLHQFTDELIGSGLITTVEK